MTRGSSLGHECLHHDAWGNDSPRHAITPAGDPCKRLAPARALMRFCLAATLPHASFARGSPAPPMTSSSLSLGLSMAG
jgi:hypothetical protein